MLWRQALAVPHIRTSGGLHALEISLRAWQKLKSQLALRQPGANNLPLRQRTRRLPWPSMHHQQQQETVEQSPFSLFPKPTAAPFWNKAAALGRRVPPLAIAFGLNLCPPNFPSYASPDHAMKHVVHLRRGGGRWISDPPAEERKHGSGIRVSQCGTPRGRESPPRGQRRQPGRNRAREIFLPQLEDVADFLRSDHGVIKPAPVRNMREKFAHGRHAI